MDEDLHDRLGALARERVEIVPYDPQWPTRYAEEEERLRHLLPADLVRRFAHIGSTAVPGLSAKPIIDVQAEAVSLERVRAEAVPVLCAAGYEHVWRPTIGERAPFYAWFIKRDAEGRRTHHVHMVEPDEASWDRIRFRDLLRADADEVRRYEALKRELARLHPNDRAAYTQGKSDYIARLLGRA